MPSSEENFSCRLAPPPPQTPQIDKREIGDAVFLGKRRIHTSLSAPPPN